MGKSLLTPGPRSEHDPQLLVKPKVFWLPGLFPRHNGELAVSDRPRSPAEDIEDLGGLGPPEDLGELFQGILKQ